MSLHVDMELKEEILVVRLIGELDHHTSEQLRERIQQMIQQASVRHLVLNLKGLTFMDSSGLGVLLGRFKQIQTLNGQMFVCHVSKEVKRLLEMSGIFKIIPLVHDEEEALRHLGVWA